MKLNWNFLGGGGGGAKQKKTSMGGGVGEYGYFLQLQIFAHRYWIITTHTFSNSTLIFQKLLLHVFNSAIVTSKRIDSKNIIENYKYNC